MSYRTPKEFINFSLQLCSNLSRILDLVGLANKMKLQQVVFPDGIGYDRQNSSYRTTRINSKISQIALLASRLERLHYFSCYNFMPL